jgi:tetratricopeptide (TPR) repeat protein
MARFFFILFVFIVSSTQAFALSVEEQTMVLESYSAEKVGNIPSAIEKMVRAFQNNQNDYYINLRLGWLFWLDKKYKNSIDHYGRAQTTLPSSLEPLLGLSLVNSTIGDYTATAKAAEQILARDSKNYYGLQRLVTAHIQLKQLKPALSRAEQGLALYPTDPIFLEQKGFVQKELGNQAGAKETLNYLLLVSPQNGYARTQLGGP